MKEHLMGQPTVWAIKKMKIVVAISIIGLSVFFAEGQVSRADEGPVRERPGVSSSVESGLSGPEQEKEPAGEIQERGLFKIPPGKMRGGVLKQPRQPDPPGGDLPANLCHQETHMMTQCRCFNNTDCQVLSTLCPGSCPVGSQTCQCIPMFRGTPPPLPPDLCSYEVPLVITQCSCRNTTDCQELSTICPGSCPVGSQSCECRPLRRGAF